MQNAPPSSLLALYHIAVALYALAFPERLKEMQVVRTPLSSVSHLPTPWVVLRLPCPLLAGDLKVGPWVGPGGNCRNSCSASDSTATVLSARQASFTLYPVRSLGGAEGPLHGGGGHRMVIW